MDNYQDNNYDVWNDKKKLLERDDRFKTLYFKQGEIWWCSLGKNIGTESFGKGDEFRRPVLVIKKLSSEMCIVLPVSMQKKQGSWFIEISFNKEKRWILLHQVRMMHTKRFQRYMGEVSTGDLILVKEKLAVLLELSYENHHLAEARIEGEAPKTTTL